MRVLLCLLLVLLITGCSNSNSLSFSLFDEKEKPEVKAFLRSIQNHHKAVSLMADASDKSSDATFIMEKETEEEVKRLLASALQEARMVSDSTLTQLSQDLPRHYREEFCKCVELQLVVFSSKSPTPDVVRNAFTGKLLLDNWLTYYKDNKSVWNAKMR